MRQLLFIFLFSLTSGVAANNVYLANTSLGGNTGVDCTNAKIYTYFNSAGNWSGSPTGIQIGPDTTVHVCGTITCPATTLILSAQGSGSAGHPVVILFESGAVMTSVACGQFIALNNNNNFLIDGGSTCGWSNVTQTTTACNGVIQNTDNGSPSLGFGHQVETTAIQAGSGGNVEIRNLAFSNIYVHDGAGNDTFPNNPLPACFTSTGDTLSFHNNVVHDVNWCLNGGTNFSIYNNEIYHMDHGFGMGPNSDTPVVTTGVFAYKNYLHDTANWDTTSGAYHHDGFHLFAYCSNGSSVCSGTYWQTIYLYNNIFGGNWGGSNTAYIFFEGNIHNAWIYNNYADAILGPTNNALLQLTGGTNMTAINNTMLGSGSLSIGKGAMLGINGPNITSQNNILANGDELVGMGGFAQGTTIQSTITALNHNVYMQPGSNAFIWCGVGSSSGGGCTFTSSFASWVSLSGETSAISPSTTTINTNGTLQSGSPAIGAGINLTASCSGNLLALCADLTGVARPTTGAWDAGAFQFGSAPTSFSGIGLFGPVTAGGPTTKH